MRRKHERPNLCPWRHVLVTTSDNDSHSRCVDMGVLEEEVNVCLIDVDSKIPNLALMKLSTFHKQRGDNVKLGYDPLFDNPDICYMSKIFNFTPEPQYVPDCEVKRGGTGYDLTAKLTPEQDACFPDYSLYGWYGEGTYSLGRFTRGCPNNCAWCVVPKMDGNDVRWVADLESFYDPRHDTVRVMDDNIMAAPELFERACKQLHDADVKVLWDALDIRLIDDRTAVALSTVRQAKSIHFSWDSKAQEPFIASGLETLQRHGMKPWRFMFYVLIGFNTSREYDLYRVETLRKLGARPFAMPYDKHDRYQRDFARWVNNKAIFNTTDWAGYDCPTNRGE